MGNQKSNLDRTCSGVLLFSILLFLNPILSGGENSPERLVLPLEEVSGFDELDFGHGCTCRNVPEPNVVYPAFSSAKPLYGVMCVDMEFGNPRSGTPYPFAIDESGGTGAGYDRLYIDFNRDGRLSDEAPITPLDKLPQGAIFTAKWVARPVWFGYVTFSSTDEAGMHSIETLPRLLIGDTGNVIASEARQSATLSFPATKARKGEIEIAKRRFSVTILNSYPLGTRWDRPWTTVKLQTQRGSTRMPYWLGSDWLMAMHEMGGTWWRLSTTPGGDQLLVEPYRGDFGTLRFGFGRRFVSKMTMAGSLLAKDRAVGIGYESDGREKPVQTCNVPVGDYIPGTMSIHCGPLLFSVSDNYLSGVTPWSRETSLPHLWKIRKNEVLTLDFSRKPEIVFTSPAQGARLKPGDELQVTPVLVDPKLNVMIRSLRRRPHEQASPIALAVIGILAVGPLVVWAFADRRRQRYRYLPWLSAAGLLVFVGYIGVLFALNAMLHPDRYGDGRLAYDDLMPQATISRADGERIAGGPMPFG